MFKRAMLYLATTSVLGLAQPVLAQSTADPVTPATPVNTPAAPAASDSTPQAADIVITGTRIKSGFSQPTPVTVIGAQQLQTAQPGGIALGLNQLPQFLGSTSPRQSQSAFSSSFQGNILNLRNAGTTRVLVLQDGVRVPPTTAQGEVDVDVIPEMLVQRVDVVTAGVSAVYGSDAVAGVVNFVLDKKFTGLKVLAQSGVSTYGDSFNYRLGLAGGTSFAGGNGHLLFSVERNSSDGIDRDDRALGLPYWGTVATGTGAIATAANPYYWTTNVLANNLARVAKISAGPSGAAVLVNGLPLINQQFSDDGRVIPFNVGTLAGGLAQIGGSGVASPSDRTLVPNVRRWQAFGRASYDITPGITIFAEASGSQAKASFHSGQSLATPLPIFADNAYLTPELKAAISAGTANSAPGTCAAGQPAVLCVMSPLFNDWPVQQQRQRVRSINAKFGVNADLGSGWHADLTYVFGQVNTRADEYNAVRLPAIFAAVDAVRDPVSGNIVCHVTLTNPGLYPGCSPIDMFTFDKTAAAQAFVDGDSWFKVLNRTNDVVGTITGQPVSTWAGPVGVSVGLEYRDGKLVRTSNSDPNTPVDVTGLRGITSSTRPFMTTNVGPASGFQRVKEANAEILVPLAKDMSFARSLSVTGAGRYTDYSISGGIWSWKVGGTYEPIRDIRFRVTRSRDIRAPTLFDLFAGGSASQASIVDPHCNCVRAGGGFITTGGGNTNLKPEIANTFSAGVVLQPTFLRQFNMSVDYYDLNIKNAITTLTPLQILTDCENSNGTAPSCSYISRPLPFSDHSTANAATSVFSGSINAAALRTKGFDFEMSWIQPLWNSARLTTRLLGNYVTAYNTQSVPNGPIRKLAGYTESAVPKTNLTLNFNYQNGPFSLFAQERRVGKLKTGKQYVYIESALPAVYYTDLTVSYTVPAMKGGVEFFATVNNAFNKQPLVFPDPSFPSSRYPTIMSLYDVVGRTFTAGVRGHF